MEMKKLLAIFFLSIYLVSTTELCELLKLPLLVEHYIEHSQENPELSIGAFLIRHYNNHLKDHPLNDDYEQDLKLPFMRLSDVLNFCFVYSGPTYYELKGAVSNIAKTQPVAFNISYPKNIFLSTIWQPPKSC